MRAPAAPFYCFKVSGPISDIYKSYHQITLSFFHFATRFRNSFTKTYVVLISANGSTTAIPEEGPPPGPPFIDFPPLLRKSGPPDSPSESSLTSAEDLENRRLEKKLEFEKMKDHFPPDIRYCLKRQFNSK